MCRSSCSVLRGRRQESQTRGCWGWRGNSLVYSSSNETFFNFSIEKRDWAPCWKTFTHKWTCSHTSTHLPKKKAGRVVKVYTTLCVQSPLKSSTVPNFKYYLCYTKRGKPTNETWWFLPRWRWRRRRRWWLPGQRPLPPSVGCPQAWSPATGWPRNRIPQTTWRTRMLRKKKVSCYVILCLYAKYKAWGSRQLA